MKDFRHNKWSECHKTTSPKQLEAMCWVTTYRLILGTKTSRKSQGLHNSWAGGWSMKDSFALGKKQNTLWKQGKCHHKEVLHSSSSNNAGAKKKLHSERISSTDVNAAKWCSDGKIWIISVVPGYQELNQHIHSYALTTETDHRRPEDIPEKPPASVWPRLHCSSFKWWRYSLKAQDKPRRKIPLGDFSWLRLCQAACCKKGGRITVCCSSTSQEKNRKWQWSVFSKRDHVKRVCTRPSSFCSGEKTKWEV